MFKANNIADFFISQVNTSSGDTISHLKLQKLVYYAQAWHVTLFNKPLFDERIEAWMHGPVIRSVYERFKDHNVYTPISLDSVTIDIPSFSEETLNLLNDVSSIYGEHSASYLEELTHQEKPWLIARGNLEPHQKCENEITLASMKAFYSTKLHGKK